MTPRFETVSELETDRDRARSSNGAGGGLDGGACGGSSADQGTRRGLGLCALPARRDGPHRLGRARGSDGPSVGADRALARAGFALGPGGCCRRFRYSRAALLRHHRVSESRSVGAPFLFPGEMSLANALAASWPWMAMRFGWRAICCWIRWEWRCSAESSKMIAYEYSNVPCERRLPERPEAAVHNGVGQREVVASWEVEMAANQWREAGNVVVAEIHAVRSDRARTTSVISRCG
jgi:hypothetical protein